MNKYLLEIGTEELPYRFIAPAQEQLRNLFQKLLETNNLKFENIKTYGTPRRLTVVLEGLEEKQDDIEKTVKGPIVNVALDENKNFTKAAIGFAAKNGVTVEDLEIKDNYVWAKIQQKGKTTKEVLQQNIENLVLSVQGPYFMRWAELETKFQRPVRWVVSLWNEDELPISLYGVKSSSFSRGHRFVSDSIKITNADTYENDLLAGKVIVDSDVRKQKIVELAKNAAQKIGAEVVFDEGLLDEVTYLNEFPVPILCEFEEKYLKIPEKVIVTVMATHQRYFPLYKNGKLLNNFITMANYVGDAFDNIRAGNERVIKARLDDAIFFFNEDTKKPLEAYVESLNGMTFQKGMGTVYDKTQRIVELSNYIAGKLGVASSSITRTAQLCKADLATSLVFEFTELQGFIGADYAAISGETKEVANGIKEHYFPLNATSELPASIEGQVVSIADKVDTIVAVFAGGKIPTGSQDPLGVRRAVLGVLKTIISKELKLDLADVIKKSISILPISIDDSEKLFKSVVDFFEQRLLIYYADYAANDVIVGCISDKNVLENLNDFVVRTKIVTELKKSNGYEALNEGANRIIRILKNTQKTADGVNKSLFKNDYERNLYAKIEKLDKNAAYEKLVADLLALSADITAFFDNVLVMDENPAVKQNRVNMLLELKECFAKIVDFSKLQ